MLAPAYDETNIFAKILRGELPCHKVYEDDVALAFMDLMPGADGITVLQYNETAGGQVVFHLHFHILPRWKDVELKPHTGAQEKPEVLEAFRAKIAAALKP